jgi:CBS domain-containing protein
MRKHHVGSVVVVKNVDENCVPLGIVTDRDIVIETIAVQLDADAFKAEDLMTTPIVAVQEDAGFVETLHLMRTHKIRRMPVVSAAGTLFGIVTSDDIINHLVMELSMMTNSIVEQPLLERQLRK